MSRELWYYNYHQPHHVYNASAADMYNTTRIISWDFRIKLKEQVRTVVSPNERVPVPIRHPPIHMFFRLLQSNVHIPIQAGEHP